MKPAGKSSLREMTLGMLLYAFVLFVSVRVLMRVPNGWWRIPVAIAPILPGLLVLHAVIRAFATMDELQRRIQLEALAFGFAASAVLTFTYGFLQGVGFPAANWTLVWPVMGATWILGLLIARRKYR